MATTDVKVNVSIHMDIDGKPVTTLIEQPATAVLHEHGEGMAVYLHLDGAKLAEAILPHILRELPRQVRASTDGKRDF